MSTDETARPRLDEIEARYSAPSAILTEVGWHATRDVPVLTAALREVLALHVDGGQSQGYAADAPGGYGYIDHCCTECGSFGEYGEPWPCNTVRAITAHIDVTSPALHDSASPERGTP